MKSTSEISVGKIRIREAVESDADALALLIEELGYPTEVATMTGRLRTLRRSGDYALVAVSAPKQSVWRCCIARAFCTARPMDAFRC